MDVRELRPRLWYWTARHPDWTPEEGGEDGWDPEVGCYSYVPPDGETLVLLDPLAPADGDDRERFWRALDRDVERHGAPQVLVTLFWHARSARELLERYDGTRVWAHLRARDEVSKRTPVTDTFAPGDALPAGLEAYDARIHDEVAYRIPEYGAVVTGDVLISAPGGPVRVWQGGDDARRALRPLLDVPVELVLLTHGEPVLERGGEALRRALEVEAQVEELRPGLWRWTAPHPDWAAGQATDSPGDWPREVGSVAYRAPEAFVLIDPLVPPDGWGALDALVDDRLTPVHVLVTIAFHERSREEAVERYSASEVVPAGVEAIPFERAGETMFWLPEHRALVPGDRLLGFGGDGLRVCPESWLRYLGNGITGEELRESLQTLLELPMELVLVSHGEPVLAGGQEAIARALEA